MSHTPTVLRIADDRAARERIETVLAVAGITGHAASEDLLARIVATAEGSWC